MPLASYNYNQYDVTESTGTGLPMMIREQLDDYRRRMDKKLSTESMMVKSSSERTSEHLHVDTAVSTYEYKDGSGVPSQTEGLPFGIPRSSILAKIGETPVVEIEPDIHLKLEGFNPSGSIKDRPVLNMILDMFRTGQLKCGSTLALITSGSAGVSLAAIQRALEEDCGVKIRTVIIMPKSYRHKAAYQKLVENGVETFHDRADPEAVSQILLLEGSFMEVMAAGQTLASENGYQTLDQHYDQNSMLAHESTALEILRQIPDVTDVVCATGSGATAAGLRRFLPVDVKVHARASQAGAIDGLSDIRRYDNFCNENLLEDYRLGMFEPEMARTHQLSLLESHGLDCGLSTGATLGLAREVKAANPTAKVACISACGRPYDGDQAPPDQSTV